MTVLLYTYTDWQADFARPLESALKESGERLFVIGRRTKGVDSTTIRGVPPGNPFKPKKEFEPEGPLPLLDDPIALENAFLTDYAYQMSRYVQGYGSRGHDMQCFHEYRDHFHLTARKFRRLIEREKITSVLFFNMPHTGDDYLLYRVADSLGLRVRMLMDAPFSNRFFSMPSIESFGRMNHAHLGQVTDRLSLEEFNQQLTGRIGAYMSSSRQNESPSWFEAAFAIQALIRRTPGSFLSPSLLSPEVAELVRLRRSLRKSRRTLRELRYGKKARSFLRWLHSLEREPDNLPQKFVYFPLHYQPEVTTEPQGGAFGDQALAIEVLISRLPPEVEIVVKENPKQGSFNRERAFTDRLRQLNRVTVVHPSVNGRSLEEKCVAVATVTGTAGWEAVRDCRPCICFGHAWYLDCPGVHKFDNSLDFSRVISTPPRVEETENFLDEIVSRSHVGTIYEYFLGRDSADFERENYKKVTDTLVGLALGELPTTFS